MNSALTVRVPDVLLSVLLAAAFAVAFAVVPLITLVLICLFSTVLAGSSSRGVFLLAACLLFTLLNISKEVEGDLINYVYLQQYLANQSILTFLDGDELRTITGSYRETELGFFLPLWVLAHLFGAGRVVIAVGATLAIYIPTYFGLAALARIERWNERLMMTVTLVVFFAAVNFNLGTHLLRQHVSSALVFLGLMFAIGGRKWPALLLALAACSIHNGTAMIVADFLVVLKLFPYEQPRKPKPWSLLLRALVVVGLVGVSVVGIALREWELEKPTDATEITIWHYVFGAVLFTLFWYFSRVYARVTKANYYISVAFGIVFTVSLVFFLAGLPLLSLRYYMYLEWLFGPALAGILCAIPRRNPLSYIGSRWALCAVALLIFLIRIHNSAWSYGPGQSAIFTEDAVQLTQYMAN